MYLPLMNREIPVVADEAVDPTFGTGAVKITPAHDPADFEMGRRHNLPEIVVIGKDGILTEEAGGYAGMTREEARRRVVQDLSDLSALVKVDDYSHAVGHCYRCSSVIEPVVSEQWFVRMKPLADPAMKAVKEGHIRLYLNALRRSTSIGWKRSGIGVSPDSFGGGTVFLSGTVRTVARSFALLMTLRSVPSVTVLTWSRSRMF